MSAPKYVKTFSDMQNQKCIGTKHWRIRFLKGPENSTNVKYNH